MGLSVYPPIVDSQRHGKKRSRGNEKLLEASFSCLFYS
jgi:hypothetical protein